MTDAEARAAALREAARLLRARADIAIGMDGVRHALLEAAAMLDARACCDDRGTPGGEA